MPIGRLGLELANARVAPLPLGDLVGEVALDQLGADLAEEVVTEERKG